MSFIYFLIIAALVAISALLSSIWDIVDKEKRGLKAITKKGRIIILLNLSVIIISVLQYNQNEIDVKQKEDEAKTEQIQRDSILRDGYDSSLYIMKQKYDSSHENIVRTIASALGEYGFRLDSSNQKLERLIKDSSKTKIILPNDPVLQVCTNRGIEIIDTTSNKHKYQIRFCSKDAGSANFKIKLDFVLADSIANYDYIGSHYFPQEAQISQDTEYSLFFDVSNNLNYSFLYILVNGTYSNIERTKSYPTDILYYYNRLGNTQGMITGKTRDSIIKFINYARSN